MGVSKQPIKDITIGRDKLTKMSRGVCYVEMQSIMDAMLLYNVLQQDSISIDGKKLIVAYKRQPKEKARKEVEKEKTEPKEVSPAKAAKKQKGMMNFTEEEIRKMAEYSA